MDSGPQVFLSYSSQDSRIVRLIEEYLVSKGYSVWLDQHEIVGGDNMVKNIFEAIAESRFLVILLTANSAKSSWVMQELSAAMIREYDDARIVVLPLLYEDCPIPAVLRSKHYIDFRQSITAGLEGLTNALETHERREKRNAQSAESPRSQEPTPDERKTSILEAVEKQEDLYLVLDLGATKAYVSLVDKEANRLFDRKFSTESHGNQEKLFEFLTSCIHKTIDGIHELCGISPTRASDRIRGLGIGFAGPTDFDNGLILDAPNFSIKNFPLTERLQKVFHFPSFVENDVNLGIIGEAWKGVAKGHKNVVGLIIGTGIGGGILIDGELYRGRHGTAGEIGHLVLDQDSTIQCGCRQFGCLEAIASRRSMARLLAERKANSGDSSITWLESNLGSNEIAYYYRAGDHDAVEIVNRAAEMCGKAVFSILNLLNPDIVFLGGGFVKQIGEVFLEPIRREAMKCMNAVYNRDGDTINISLGSLDNPILIGAAKMVIDNAQGQPVATTRAAIVHSVMEGLDALDLKRLRTIAQAPINVPISKDPKSDFAEEKLRVLRNRGLIATEANQAFRLSKCVHITGLGKIVLEE